MNISSKSRKLILQCCALIALFAIVCAGTMLLYRHHQKERGGVEGFWSGNVDLQGEKNHLPAQAFITGKGKCLLLRHKGSDLDLELGGSFPKGELVQLSLNQF